MPRPVSRRLSSTAALTAAGTLALVSLAAPMAHATPTGAPACTNELLPGITQDDPQFTDNGVAVFVGGDYVALKSAAESEGQLFVGGTTTVDAGLFNIGRAGGGSQITPAGGSDVLVSAGAVTVMDGSTVDVNHGVTGGGNVVSRTSITGNLQLNGGISSEKDNTAAATVATTEATLTDVSARLSALSANGELGTAGGFPALMGDGTGDTQVFDLTAEQAAGLDAVTFVDVGRSAPIVINVSGTDATLDSVHTAAGSVADRIDTWTELGAWAPRIIWNFPDATSLELSGGSQLVGSILAPHADTTQTTNTNGRLWIGGDLEFGASGSGLEHHNYPWIGAGELGCEPVTPQIPETDPEKPGPTVPTDAPSSTPTDAPSEEPAAPATEEPATEEPGDEPTDGTVVPEATETPTTEVLGTSIPSPAEAAVAETDEDTLAVTGATVGWMASVAALLTAAGVTLLILRRRQA
ncbi:choice-of-anchor A family protein [Paraoerskovia marina]|uniref:choice-of-anchor A family protein n=1 Tax=Paraoerskovia marina TaxID=545619 RepID=UPI000492831E|nr:choice-of-anchor A family protein [Paraoerskovia marina]